MLHGPPLVSPNFHVTLLVLQTVANILLIRVEEKGAAVALGSGVLLFCLTPKLHAPDEQIALLQKLQHSTARVKAALLSKFASNSLLIFKRGVHSVLGVLLTLIPSPNLACKGILLIAAKVVTKKHAVEEETITISTTL